MTKRIVGSFLAIFVMMIMVVCFAPALFVNDVTATGVDFTVNNTNVILEMHIPASVTLNLLPSSGRAFDVQTLPIWIGTNSGAGYTLKMQTDSASLTRISSITDREGNKTFPTIAPMTTVGSTTGYTEEQFMSDNSDSDTLNRWGYKLSTNTNYIPITTNEITLSSTNAPSNGTNIGVDFAAKIDASQPTGLYATTLNFVAVTNNTNTAFTINFDGNGLHFGDDPNNTVNVVTYDATRTGSQSTFYSCSDNFYYDDCYSDNGVPSFYNYGYGVNAGSLNPAESTTVTLKYGLGSHEEDGVIYPDYLFVLNGYYEDDGAISDTLYNVLVNVCNQDVNCAKERMALRNVELIDVFSGSAVDGDATVPITTSFGIDAANASGLPPKPDPFNPDSGLLPVENSGITFVIAGFEQSTSNAYGYHATIKQTGNWVDGLEKTVISGAYAVPTFPDSGVTEFLGWSEDPEATVPIYKNADEIVNNLNAVNGDVPVTLYAVYHHAEIEMQNLHPSLCTESGTYTYDNRDNKIYLVKRLADGKCWMLDDLTLNLMNPDVQAAMLNNEDTKTNATYWAIDKLFNGGGANPYTIAAISNSSSEYSGFIHAEMTDAYNSYNYCAASAGSYCYEAWKGLDRPSTAIDVVEDICPAGWRMPTGGPAPDACSGCDDGEFQNLYDKYDNRSAFLEALAMPYYGGYFWSSTSYDGARMYSMYYYDYYSSVDLQRTDRSRGSSGRVRCVSQLDGDTYTVNFNANGGIGAMTPEKIDPGVARYLTRNSFIAPVGMIFDGWNTAADGTGTSYVDGESVTDLASVGYAITLYAQWRESCVGYTTLQSLNSFNIGLLLPAINDTATVCDMRDDEKYIIGKLADGKVWMLEDLRIAKDVALSVDDTDVTGEYIGGLATEYHSGLFKIFSDRIVLSNPRSSKYSWRVATLDGKRSDGEIGESRTGYNAAASICPKNWRLPTATTSNADAKSDDNWKTGDWYALATAYGANLENNYQNYSSTFYNNAGPGTIPNFHSGGYYNGDGWTGGNYYWSATVAQKSYQSFYMYFSTEGVSVAVDQRDNPNSINNQAWQMSVRCILSDN